MATNLNDPMNTTDSKIISDAINKIKNDPSYLNNL